jgi:hypothetical protein
VPPRNGERAIGPETTAVLQQKHTPPVSDRGGLGSPAIPK